MRPCHIIVGIRLSNSHFPLSYKVDATLQTADAVLAFGNLCPTYQPSRYIVDRNLAIGNSLHYNLALSADYVAAFDRCRSHA